MIVPIICERCGTQKRAEDGRALWVSWHWRRGKRMICPACFDGEQTLRELDRIVNTDDGDEVPF